jgi:ribosome-binding protein aMBF1 (putative translation factor)
MSSTTNPNLKSIDLGIAERLRTDATFRARYLRAWARTEVANQIREMRQRRRMRQQDVAKKSGTGQSAISRIEKADYEGWTFKTLAGLPG